MKLSDKNVRISRNFRAFNKRFNRCSRKLVYLSQYFGSGMLLTQDNKPNRFYFPSIISLFGSFWRLDIKEKRMSSHKIFPQSILKTRRLSLKRLHYISYMIPKIAVLVYSLACDPNETWNEINSWNKTKWIWWE